MKIIKAINNGFHIISSNTKTLPNGNTMYCYSESDRKKGRAMFIIGVAVLVSFVVLKIIQQL
jgi:hypothetical protein